MRAVSFDAHGTLILPQPSVEARYAAMAEQFGVELDPAHIPACFFFGVSSRARSLGYSVWRQ
jgi:FMN phosphatase YigB (HAD superfamily)